MRSEDAVVSVVSLFIDSLLNGSSSITVRVGVVVLRSASGTNGGRVRPDVVLGFVDGSTVKELHFDVPEVESVGPDGLEDDGSNTHDHLDDEDRQRVILGSIGEDFHA